MQFDEFIGQVQHRARLRSRLQAQKAVEATLRTLAERLVGGAAGNLASQLPQEIAAFLREAGPGGREMTLQEFFEAVARREGVDAPKAAFHARCVLDVLRDATAGTLEKVRDQLPEEWDPLFEAGSEGRMDLPD